MQNLMIDVDSLSNVIMSNSPVFFHSFSITHTSAQTCILLKSWLSDSDTQLQWMNEVEKAPTALRKDLFLMIGGLIIEYTTSSVLLSKCLSFMLKLTADLPELGTAVLTWFLYRLAREQEPEDQLQLLRALPSLGSQKENVALVIHTLESLKESREIKCLVLNLYLRLWHQEPRCFPYLHKMLSEPMSEKISVQREWFIACAATMKEICATRPSLHGTDLVPLLSNVLNNCMSSEGAVASSLAIQAIVSLCEARIVDVATTWKALAPRLSRDTRVPVIRSLCDLLGLMSNIKSTNTDQSKLFAESQAKLWSYVVNNNDSDVKVAALRGLSQFSLEQFSLKIMPPCFRQNLKLPSEYAKTPIDAARKPEDVLPYIPGECWPQLLAAVPSATLLLKILLSVEVSAMRGALHRHTGKAEPSLPPLARNSVCLGLISHLRRCADEPDTAMVPCLEVLSSLSKALPPCDWSFLQNLAKYEQCHFLCLTLATRQAHCSSSARVVAEQLVEKLETRAGTKFSIHTYEKSPNGDDVLAGFTILEDLCKGVPPKTLRPLIENALQTSLKAAQNEDKDVSLFRDLMRHMKRALQKEDIHDANRTLLSMILEGILEQLSLDDEEIFSCYVETVGDLSSKFLDRMSSPSVWWEVTPVKLQKAIAIRSHIAVQADSETPLIWLNECIDAAAATNPREQDLLLCKLYEVLVFSHGKSTNKDWVLELMGHIQAALTSTDKLEEASFLCDVFALAVVVLSGHHCLCPKPTAAAASKETRLSLLPQALLSLLEYPEWKTVTGQQLVKY
ncbi:hypothetical protein B566_EDAN015645 [Ephemera danica]|nr:hypothetical protein B566_EDAN015645 [Ephemera danica]